MQENSKDMIFLVFDEIELAEYTKNNPLKEIHNELEFDGQ